MGKVMIILIVSLAVTTAVQGAFVAYNDFASPYTGESANVTKISIGGSGGTLLDYTTGASTGVTLSGTGFTGVTSGNNITPGVGTDFYSVFGGIVDQVGAAYGATGSMTLSGLNPSALYELVIFGNRDYTTNAWQTKLVITGADSFTNTSSAGATVMTTNVANDTTILPIINGTTGYVARFDAINAGSDGSIVIQLSAIGTNGYVNAIRLAEVPEPATMGLLGLGALAILRRRSR